jgi:hypothetical protein
MTVIDDSRAALRARTAKAQAAEPEPWHFPNLSEFRRDQYVLAFDATLTNCGWVFFSVCFGMMVEVIAKGTVRPKTAEVGYLGTWDKADQLRSEVDGLVRRWRAADPQSLIVVEAPSVGGGSRTESSLIAGMLVWSGRRSECAVVSATHVSAVLLGDPKIKSAPRKKAVKEAVVRLYPPAAGRDWNEHERDSLATGLVHLYDVRQKGRDERRTRAGGQGDSEFGHPG